MLNEQRELHESFTRIARPVNAKRTLMKRCSFEWFSCMAKPRDIAPWHREGLVEEDLEAMSPEGVELLASLKGKPANYHCVSRVVGREFVFKREEREQFVGLMRRYENFAQVKI